MLSFLVVDDNPAMRRRVIDTLKSHYREDLDFSEAGSGLEALDILKRKDIDLVTLDWYMPEMDGMQLLEHKKALGLKAPVIMITIERSRDKMVEALMKGAKDFLSKPYLGADLLKKTDAILKEAGRAPQVRELRDADKRRHPRRPVSINARFMKPGRDGTLAPDLIRVKQARIVNISGGGACLQTEYLFYPGDTCHIEALGSGLKLTARCAIIYARKEERDNVFGCQFLEVRC